SYEILVLPREQSMEYETLKKIQALVKAGAWVLGPKPLKDNTLSQNRNEKEIREMADIMWGENENLTESNYGKGKIFINQSIKEVLDKKAVVKDFDFVGEDFKLDYIHRRLGETEIYFLSNPLNDEIFFDAFFRVKDKKPEFWDPLKGTTFDFPVYKTSETGTHIPIVLPAYGSCFIIFSKNEDGQAYTNILKDDRVLFPAMAGKNPPFAYKPGGELFFFQEGDYRLVAEDEELAFSSKGLVKTIELNKSWETDFTDPWGESFKVVLDSLQSLSSYEDERIRFFSGTATYRKVFELSEDLKDKNIYLTFSEPSDIAEFFINGKSIGIVWAPPYKLDITKYVRKGGNEIKIEVANNWANILAGEARKPVENRRYHTNISRLPNGWHTPFEEIPGQGVPLQNAGIWNLKLEFFK
ncbi:MAG: glycosylhydrolase-like jelly roll fold domain-containing protein, partial [Bacteroidota bacterium]